MNYISKTMIPWQNRGKAGKLKSQWAETRLSRGKWDRFHSEVSFSEAKRRTGRDIHLKTLRRKKKFLPLLHYFRGLMLRRFSNIILNEYMNCHFGHQLTFITLFSLQWLLFMPFDYELLKSCHHFTQLCSSVPALCVFPINVQQFYC